MKHSFHLGGYLITHLFNNLILNVPYLIKKLNQIIVMLTCFIQIIHCEQKQTAALKRDAVCFFKLNKLLLFFHYELIPVLSLAE